MPLFQTTYKQHYSNPYLMINAEKAQSSPYSGTYQVPTTTTTSTNKSKNPFMKTTYGEHFGRVVVTDYSRPAGEGAAQQIPTCYYKYLNYK